MVERWKGGRTFFLLEAILCNLRFDQRIFWVLWSRVGDGGIERRKRLQEVAVDESFKLKMRVCLFLITFFDSAGEDRTRDLLSCIL